MTTTTTTQPATRVNVKRLLSELEWVTAHPEQWDQAEWISQTECGTACCIAGWTVLHEPGVVPMPGMTTWVVGPDGKQLHVASYAQELLGLHPIPADLLFNGSNSLRDLWRIANEVTDGAIEIPADLPGGAA